MKVWKHTYALVNFYLSLWPAGGVEDRVGKLGIMLHGHSHVMCMIHQCMNDGNVGISWCCIMHACMQFCCVATFYVVYPELWGMLD